jgi:histidinol dehydrogenase
VGLWIPGGSVPLVSTVIMTAVLARLAQVPEIAVFTPPGREGKVAPALLAALRLCGITEVYRLGGVMAVGAMAYGTQTIRAVDKVFGPGNDYVIEAKRQVFGTIGVDLLPGPSEVMVLADSTAEPALIAADLLAQAEHGSGKEKVYLVTTDASLVAKVEAALLQQLATLSHADKIRKVLEVGAVAIVAPDLFAAVKVANYVAPEHLEVHTAPESFECLIRHITTAGAILLGRDTPTVLGDFTAGPSHTLPTGRAGRFCSGLRLEDFYRRTSIVRYDKTSLAKARPIVAAFAELERLDAHGRSLEARF